MLARRRDGLPEQPEADLARQLCEELFLEARVRVHVGRRGRGDVRGPRRAQAAAAFARAGRRGARARAGRGAVWRLRAVVLATMVCGGAGRPGVVRVVAIVAIRAVVLRVGALVWVVRVRGHAAVRWAGLEPRVCAVDEGEELVDGDVRASWRGRDGGRGGSDVGHGRGA